MERLLREWGADKAARREAASAPPLAASRTPGRRRTLVPWLAAAAGFLFFAAGAALFTATWLGRQEGQGEAPPGPPAPAPGLRAELDAALRDLAAARRQLDEERKAADEADRLRREAEAETENVRTQAERDLAALRQDLDAKRTALRKAEADLADRQRRLAAFSQLHEDLQTRYRALVESDKSLKAEAAGLRRERDDLLAAQRKTDEQLKALQAQRSALARLWREASRPADVSLEANVEALQKIARDGRLLRRGAALRDRIRDATLRQIFDTHEVLLTQLDLLNVENPAEVQAFARRVRAFQDDLAALERFGTAEGDPEVRAWLLETRLLLGEVKHEG
jgi:hypothetical protein